MINTIQVNNDLSEIKKIREIKEDLKKQKQAEEERIKFNYESQIKEYEYSDDLLKELKEKGYGQYIRTTEEVDKITLKSELIVDKDGKCFTDAGEEIEGVKVVDGGYTWAVKLNA